MALTFNPPTHGSLGNWNTGTDANSLIKPKKQLAMGKFSAPSHTISGRKGLPRGVGLGKPQQVGKYKSKAIE